MPCLECLERQRRLKDAIMRGKLADAAGEAVAGFAEMTGLKEKDAENALDRSGPSEMGSEDEEAPTGDTADGSARFAHGDDADRS